MSTAPYERSREVRIGLVMYGGVSLAVYINGVAQEFYQAISGNGVYNLLKELTDSEVVLDIVSGSSAGGINGILLSYALANGKDFTPCAQLWRNAADIRRLVRSPFQGGTAVRSVLDSEGYYQTELENAFRLLDATPASPESPSPTRELDLFVTGTDMEGNVHSSVDDAGHAILLKDHRAVFHLKHRQGRKSNFDASTNPAVVTALSKLARITSCFPGAFSPVFVPSQHAVKDPSRMSANELLQSWGNLKHDAHYIDGGVIDNKPFTHTIREIFNRTADREVERRLYYVEPDPERFEQPETPNGLETVPPGFLKPIIDSLVAIPGYESIADDLKLLASRNQDIQKYRRVLQDIDEAYARASVRDHGIDVPEDLPEPLQSIYKRSRFASISDRVLTGIFRDATFDNAPQIERQRAELIRVFDERTKASPQTLRDFDVYFRLRRAYHVVDYIYERLYKSGDSTRLPEDKYRELLKALNEEIKRLHIICIAMERLVDEVDHGWSDSRHNDASAIWDHVQAALHRLLHFGEGGLPLQDLNELNRVLKRRLENSKASDFDIPNFASVLLKTDELEARLLESLGDASDPVIRHYRMFNVTDAHLFPIEWVSGLREKDIVEVVRISPADAQRGFSNRPAPEKISGDSLAHFSAFFKRTWRSNDILWGRMDGLCELVETLLTKERIAAAMSRDAARRRARSVLLPDEGSSPLEAWFRNSSPQAIETLRQWVDRVTGEDAGDRAAAIESFYSDQSAQPAGEELRDLLIEMAQFQILNTCLPDVFEDSIKEQAEWNRTRKPKPQDAGEQSLYWTGGDVALSGPAFDAFSKLSGKQMVESLKDGPSDEVWPRRTALGKAFASFRVGSEGIFGGGMPPLILAEIVSRSLLVLRNCLLGAVPSSISDKVRSSFSYRWLVELPLRAVYGGILFLKTAPAYESAVLATATVLSVFALFVGIGWRDSIIYSGNALNISWFAVFILVPLSILLGEVYLLARSRLGRTSLTASVQNAVTLLLLAAPVFSVALLYFGITDTLLEWLAGTSELPDNRYTTLWMVFLYGFVPFVLSFLGGYLAVRDGWSRRLDPAGFREVLERLTDSELQDVADRMGHHFAVVPDTRRNAATAIVAKAVDKAELGKLERSIRASSTELE